MVALTTHVYVLPAVSPEFVTCADELLAVSVLVCVREAPPSEELQAAV